MKYVGYAAIFLGIIIVLTAVSWGLGLFNVFMSNTVQRIGTQQSLPYVQTKQAELVGLVQQIRAIDVKIAETDDAQLIKTYKAQKQAIINKIEQDKSFIPADQVPAEAQQY